MKTFWQKNQVFLIGLAGAIALALQQFIEQPTIDWKVIGFSALIAVAGYVSNEWRGKGVTSTGFIGVVAYAFVTIQTTGHFSWNQFVLLVIVNWLSMVAPPPKSAGYEKSSTIQTAKTQGEVIQKKTETTPPPQI